jgi:hypothetical protein
MITLWAANDFGDNLGDGVAGPVGLLIIVLLVIATVFLMRSMNKHLKRIPERFPDDADTRPTRSAADQSAPRATTPDARSADAVADVRAADRATPGAIDADR